MSFLPSSALKRLPSRGPGFVPPMQAKLCRQLPKGDQWRYELKLDGFRALAIKTTAAVRLISRYEADKRTGAWMKFKCGYRKEFVIGGYTSGKGGRSAFGALIVGYHDQGQLRYASKVGPGFSDAIIRQIIEATQPLRQAWSPFARLPESDGSSWTYGLTAADRRNAIWLKPVLTCRVRFTEWTRDGHLRHPCFQGLVEAG